MFRQGPPNRQARELFVTDPWIAQHNPGVQGEYLGGRHQERVNIYFLDSPLLGHKQTELD